MLKASKREKEGWLSHEVIETFPSTDLHTIDQLWVKYSQERFGFSVQKQIWQDCGSPTEKNEDWEKFGDCVGWRTNQEWLSYSNLTFALLAPQGHLPNKWARLKKWGGEVFLVMRSLDLILVSLLSR